MSTPSPFLEPKLPTAPTGERGADNGAITWQSQTPGTLRWGVPDIIPPWTMQPLSISECLLTGEGWSVIGAQRQGRSHQKEGIACQDASAWGILPASSRNKSAGPILIAVISDGAGSASRAEEASRQASISFVQACLEEFRNISHLPDSEREKDWEQRLRRCLERVQDGLVVTARGYNLTERDFACTLVGVVCSSETTAALQIGDGCAVFLWPNDDLEALTEPQSGEHSNETIFVTSRDVTNAVQIRAVARACKAVALMSDGLQQKIYKSRKELDIQQDPQYRAQFEDLKRVYQKQVQELKEQHESLISALQEEYTRRHEEIYHSAGVQCENLVERFQGWADDQLLELKKGLEEIKTQHEAQKEELKRPYNERIESLNREIEAMSKKRPDARSSKRFEQQYKDLSSECQKKVALLEAKSKTQYEELVSHYNTQFEQIENHYRTESAEKNRQNISKKSEELGLWYVAQGKDLIDRFLGQRIEMMVRFLKRADRLRREQKIKEGQFRGFYELSQAKNIEGLRRYLIDPAMEELADDDISLLIAAYDGI